MMKRWRGLIADAGVSCCLMHNREKIDYRDFLPDCMADMRKIIETAKVAGIAEDKMFWILVLDLAKRWNRI